MLRFFTLMVAMFAPTVAFAQPAPLGCPPGNVPCTAIMQFQPAGAPVTLSVSTTSANVQLGAAATNYSALVSNTGSNGAFVALGGAGVTATTSSPAYVPAGGFLNLAVGTATYIAAITASSTTSLTISTGTGVPQIAYTQSASGGGGSAPTVTANQGTPGSAWPVTTTVSTLSYSASTSGTVATTSGTLITAGTFVHVLQICTTLASTTNIYLNPTGAAAVVGAGLPVYAGGRCINFGTQALPIPTANITAITDGVSSQAAIYAGG